MHLELVELVGLLFMGFGDWVRLMNWGCVPGSLNGWVGVSPPLWLDGLVVRLIPVGSLLLMFFVKPSDGR